MARSEASRVRSRGKLVPGSSGLIFAWWWWRLDKKLEFWSLGAGTFKIHPSLLPDERSPMSGSGGSHLSVLGAVSVLWALRFGKERVWALTIEGQLVGKAGGI